MQKTACAKRTTYSGHTTEYSHCMHACRHELLTCIERPAALAARVLPLPREWPQKQLSTKHAHFAIKSQHTQAARKHPMRVQRARALLQPTCCNLQGCSIALLRSGPGQRCGCRKACPAQPLNVPGALHCVTSQVDTSRRPFNVAGADCPAQARCTEGGHECRPRPTPHADADCGHSRSVAKHKTVQRLHAEGAPNLPCCSKHAGSPFRGHQNQARSGPQLNSCNAHAVLQSPQQRGVPYVRTDAAHFHGLIHRAPCFRTKTSHAHLAALQHGVRSKQL